MRYKYPVTILPTLSPSFDWRAEKIDWPVTTDVGRGLSGVIATTTEVMWLDPVSGSLAYRLSGDFSVPTSPWRLAEYTLLVG